VTTGQHQLEVVVAGKLDGGRPYSRTEHFSFAKGVEPKLIGLTVGSAEVRVGDW
jgi:hypothetical protein